MTSPMRVERALRMLPSIDVMDLLRAQLLATARLDDREKWSSSSPYLTVGKRLVDVDSLRQRIGQFVPQVAEHMAKLYDAYVRGLAAYEAGDTAGCVTALADGAEVEVAARRLMSAHAWYEAAFRVSSEMTEGKFEITMLDKLGSLNQAIGRYVDAARYHQRAFVLAEAAFDAEATIRAAIGLGDSSLSREELGGASAWYQRAQRLATGSTYHLWRGRLEHQLALIAWRQGHITAAREHLQRGRELLEPLGANADIARICCTVGRVEQNAGQVAESLQAFREAIAWAGKNREDAPTLVTILTRLAEVLAGLGRFLDADEELRRAEELAINRQLTDRLVDVYVGFGMLCTAKADETGFVFFEQAVELCRALGSVPSLEGRVYEKYGAFRLRLGGHEEAQAHFDRARQIYVAAGNETALARLRASLESLTA